MREIEICCGTLDDVMAARFGGACRVELCSAIEVGGLTPSAGLIAGAVRERDAMRVNVLVRPRAGGFVYDRRDLAVMEADIAAVKAAGAHGVVIGALTEDGQIDMPAMRRLLDAARGLDVTFHRAFDVCVDPGRALEQIIELDIPRLLTSGCRPSAEQGAPFIKELVRQAAGRISIMPGAGINPDNIARIEEITGAREFHSTASDKQAARPRCALFGSAAPATSETIVRALVDSDANS